jgi:prepilin-type N-terminal cleavage/methylation domain-containing protein
MFANTPHTTINHRSPDGFTFIEVLVAMLIFVLAVLAAVDIVQGSVRATRDAREVSIATRLLQNVMVDLETKLETQGFDKACDKKKDGKFESPHENYTWITQCGEIDFNLSQTASQIAGAGADEGSEESTTENQLQKTILQTASSYISKSLREIHAQVSWVQGKDKRTVDVTTHVVRFDQPLVIGGMGTGN